MDWFLQNMTTVTLIIVAIVIVVGIRYWLRRPTIYNVTGAELALVMRLREKAVKIDEKFHKLKSYRWHLC